jgi:hypothetical protein
MDRWLSCVLVSAFSIAACEKPVPEPVAPAARVGPSAVAAPPAPPEPDDSLGAPTFLLGGRLTARLPTTVRADDVMRTSDPMDVLQSASLHPFGTEAVPLAIAVMDVPRIAGADLGAGATAYLARPRRNGETPRYAVSPLETTPPIRAVLAVPEPLARWTVPHDISVYAYGPAGAAVMASSALFVALPDGGVVAMELVCAEESCPRPRLEALARAIAPTIAPGPSHLSRAAATRRAQALEIDVPADFAFERLQGEDYLSFSFAPLVGLGAPPPPALNVFLTVSLPPTEESLAAPVTQRARFLGRNARFTVARSDGGVRWTHECYLEGALYTITMSAADDAGIGAVAALAATARLSEEEGFEPDAVCEPYDPCPGQRYTQIVTRHLRDRTVAVRASPSASAPVVANLEVAIEVTIAERRAGFVHVRTPSDGWVEAAHLVGLCE